MPVANLLIRGTDPLAERVAILLIPHPLLVFHLVRVDVGMRLELGGAGQHVWGHCLLLQHLLHHLLFLRELLVCRDQAFLQRLHAIILLLINLNLHLIVTFYLRGCRNQGLGLIAKLKLLRASVLCVFGLL